MSILLGKGIKQIVQLGYSTVKNYTSNRWCSQGEGQPISYNDNIQVVTE